jgi:uncharacterized protein (DUF2384 family)
MIEKEMSRKSFERRRETADLNKDTSSRNFNKSLDK